MPRLRLFLFGSAALALAAACSSSDEGGDSDGSGGAGTLPDGAPPLLADADTGTGFTGGTRPLPDGGLDALRDASCAGWSATAEPMASVLMLVVDVSNSMNETAPGSRQSKWEVTLTALQSAIDALPASTAVGVLFYPNQDTGERTQPAPVTTCVATDELIPVDVLGSAGSTQRDTIQQALQRVNVTGGTPTYDAYGYALQELEATTLPGNKFMLLITDGLPTYGPECVGDGTAESATDAYIAPILESIGAAHTAGTDTFIIGSPGSERTSSGSDARPWLSHAAELGGTASDNCSHTGPNYCHFDMVAEADFAAGLTAALGQIAGQIVQCDYALPAPPAGETLNPDQVNVVYTTSDGQQLLVLRNAATDCQDGWSYSADSQQLLLCSDTCAQIQADRGASLELMFGCASEQLPPR
jgi:hypothetical protein